MKKCDQSASDSKSQKDNSPAVTQPSTTQAESPAPTAKARSKSPKNNRVCDNNPAPEQAEQVSMMEPLISSCSTLFFETPTKTETAATAAVEDKNVNSGSESSDLDSDDEDADGSQHPRQF